MRFFSLICLLSMLGNCRAGPFLKTAQDSLDLLAEYNCDANATTILRYRQYTPWGPAVDGSQRPGYSIDPTDRDNYGAINFFIRNVLEGTAKLGSDKCVLFEPVPINFPCIGTAVGTRSAEECDGIPASFHTMGPSDTSRRYGALLVIGGLFGMDFSNHIDWLYNVLPTVQSIIDKREENTVVIPAVGGLVQSSGMFRQNLYQYESYGDICRIPQIWRSGGFQASNMRAACRAILGADVYNPDFCEEDGFLCPANGVSGVPPLEDIATGAIDGFEYAGATDNLDVFFENSDVGPNPGQFGMTFYHYPAWHQPFYIGGMYVNGDVWNGLGQDLQAVIMDASRPSVEQSREASTSVECDALKSILEYNSDEELAMAPTNRAAEGIYLQCDPNNGTFTGIYTDDSSEACSAKMSLGCWRESALQELREVTDSRLRTLNGTAFDSVCQGDEDCIDIVESLLDYQESIGFEWTAPTFPADCEIGFECDEDDTSSDANAGTSFSNQQGISLCSMLAVVISIVVVWVQ